MRKGPPRKEFDDHNQKWKVRGRFENHDKNVKEGKSNFTGNINVNYSKKIKSLRAMSTEKRESNSTTR